MVALLGELKAYAGDLYGAATGSVDRWVAANLQKRLLSSPAALRSSIDRRLSAVTRGTALDGGSVTVKLAEESTSDLLFAEDDEADAAHMSASVGLAREIEVARLQVIAGLAKKVTPAKDPKLAALFRLLPERMAAHPRVSRVLVFTKYKDTLDYLVTNLTRAVGRDRNGLPPGTQVFAIHGGLNLAQRK